MKKEYTAPKMEIVEMGHQDDLLLCLSNCGDPAEKDDYGVEEEG